MNDDDDLAPGVASEIYQLGKKVGLREGFWLGYADALVDLIPGPEDRNHGPDLVSRPCRPYGFRWRPLFGGHLGGRR